MNPAQTDEGLAVRISVGVGFTITVNTFELTQPNALVPFIVYAVDVVGFTIYGLKLIIEVPTSVYEVAPEGVSVELPPGHIAEGLCATLILGVGLTVTITEPVLLQPAALPVSV